MDAKTEKMIDEFRPRMEAIVFLRDGTVEKVETRTARNSQSVTGVLA